VCSLVYSVLRQADSDTARITTAAGLLGSILNIINRDNSLKESSGDLINDIQLLQKACNVAFGDNKSQLQNATDSASKKIDDSLVQEVLNSKIRNGEYFDHQFLKVASEIVLLEEDARGNKQIRGYTATMLTRLEYFLENPDCSLFFLSQWLPLSTRFFSGLITT
jgi:hypothetical protein